VDSPASEMNTRGAWSANRANTDFPILQDDFSRSQSPAGQEERLFIRIPAWAWNFLPIDEAKDDSPVLQENGDTLAPPPNRKRNDSGCDPDETVQRKTKKTRYASPRDHSVTPTIVGDELDDEDIIRLHTEAVGSFTDIENDNNYIANMDKPALPSKLKLKMPAQTPFPSSEQAQTPVAQTPTARTPSIKLNFTGKKPADDSGKKRKREEEGGPVLKTAEKTAPKVAIKLAGPKSALQTPITPGGLKLQTKGRIAKRPLGVGYDSELSDTERDPVIHEGFILRMQPGPDCDYIKEHIRKDTMGTFKMQGGADVGFIVLDDKGRRCILRVRQNKYAATLVDLPTIIEGMKSWDKMRFIKSIDICQMMLVLGPIKTEDEAKSYPLPAAVDPKTYKYAHGATAPMNWVRKRRFDRTLRTRVEDIEAIDRRVHKLLAADAQASHVDWELLDHDPRLDEDQYSEEEEDDDEDAEGEEDEEEAPEGYFDGYDQAEEPAKADIDDLEAMLGDGDDDEYENVSMPGPLPAALDVVMGDSSFAASTADSPDVTGSAVQTTAPTPIGDISTPAAPTPGTDGDDESDEDDDRDDREEQNEQDEQKSQLKERIRDLESKINEQTDKLRTQTNAILKRRLAVKVQELQKDVDMLMRELGRDGGDVDGGD
jgi:transcription initiation factor TFIID subunit 7